MSKNQKGFSILLILGLGLVVLVVGFVLYLVAVNEVGKRHDKQELTTEMHSISFPASWKLQAENYQPGGLDNDAEITVTYLVGGSRDTVFNQVVSSLGLNPADHQHSTDQQLNGVGSPKYKWLFFVNLQPFDSNDSKGYCSDANIAKRHQTLDECWTAFESLRKNDRVKTVNVSIVKR